VDEETFALGIPATPLYLAQIQSLDQTIMPRISLSAFLIRSAELWGDTTRWACDVRRHSANPMDMNSEYARFSTILPEWRMVT
jgi:hypothetical protein